MGSNSSTPGVSMSDPATFTMVRALTGGTGTTGAFGPTQQAVGQQQLLGQAAQGGQPAPPPAGPPPGGMGPQSAGPPPPPQQQQAQKQGQPPSTWGVPPWLAGI